jgi:hypothetical protein
VGAALIYMRKDMANLIGVFRDYANVPKKGAAYLHMTVAAEEPQWNTIIRRAASKRIYVFLKATVRR